MVAKVWPPDSVVRNTPLTITVPSAPSRATLSSRWPGSKWPRCRPKRPVRAPRGQRQNQAPSPRLTRRVSRRNVTVPRMPRIGPPMATPSRTQPAVRWTSVSGVSSTSASRVGWPSWPVRSHHPVASNTNVTTYSRACSQRVARLVLTTGPPGGASVRVGIVFLLGCVGATTAGALADRHRDLVARVGQAVVGVGDDRLDRVLTGGEVAIDGPGLVRAVDDVVLPVGLVAVVVEVHVVQPGVGLADVDARVDVHLEPRFDRGPIGGIGDRDRHAAPAARAATAARIAGDGVVVVTAARRRQQRQRCQARPQCDEPTPRMVRARGLRAG